ncbi:MAG: sigma 54-interacting transcriptional regulator [Myxococcales bacterium]|nr:sigma 54-interacting transcriptional regulator [Myxococcales bacterium]
MSELDETLSRPPQPAASLEPAACVVNVIAGPDCGARLLLTPDSGVSALVGKSPACDLRLADPSVSRRHASLLIGEHGILLRDLGSTNGTWVAGARVVEAWLRTGETVHLGDTVIRLEAAAQAKTSSLSSATSFGGLLGASREMRAIYPLCERLARSDIPILIEGETGTGKEVLAEALHAASPRAKKPFVVFDCTAAPANLLESDLFGHERGAFTGAASARAGVFEEANGGTLFIDEIGDLDLPLQAKLLRAVERQEVRRVGANRWVKVDVRILSATRRDLDREVQEGRFRDDLFHRLVVGRVELPALRHRRGDVTLLARHFCRQLGADQSTLNSRLLAQWEALPWPGNVRELRNVVARQIALAVDTSFAEGDSSGIVDLFSSAAPAIQDDILANPLVLTKQRVIEALESWYVRAMLDRHDGSVSQAAEAAGVAKRYFQLLNARRKRTTTPEEG